MKKLAILLIVVILFALTGCAGIGDWSYKIGNNYELWHFNSKDICIIKVDSESGGTSVLTDYIKEFRYNERYLLLKAIKRERIEQYSTQMSMKKILEDVSKDEIDYYIIDMSKDKISKSLTLKEFEEFLEKIDTHDMNDWIVTYSLTP